MTRAITFTFRLILLGRYLPTYLSNYVLDSTTIDLLRKWFRHKTTQELVYDIKKTQNDKPQETKPKSMYLTKLFPMS